MLQFADSLRVRGTLFDEDKHIEHTRTDSSEPALAEELFLLTSDANGAPVRSGSWAVAHGLEVDAVPEATITTLAMRPGPIARFHSQFAAVVPALDDPSIQNTRKSGFFNRKSGFFH